MHIEEVPVFVGARVSSVPNPVVPSVKKWSCNTCGEKIWCVKAAKSEAKKAKEHWCMDCFLKFVKEDKVNAKNAKVVGKF